MNLQNFDRFLVACQDKGIIDSATYTESANKVTYKLISGARTVLLHVKEGQALLQSVGKDKLECIKSNNLDRVLPRIISQALFPAQNFKTPFGIYQGVFIAPIAKHRITSSTVGVDPTNGEIYQDNFLFVNDNGNITVYVKYADDWNLLRSFETRAEAVLFCDKLSWNLTKASEMKESADMAAEMGESSKVEENVPVEETLDEEAMLNDVSEDLEAYALPEEIEAFEEDPSIETLPVAEDIEFMTSSGKRFIVSHDESQVTMGFYNLLKDAQGEEAMMLLPTLVAPDNVRIKVESSASLMKDILSSYSLLPKNASVPKDSLVQVSQNFVLSKADFKNVFKANRILKSSFSDSLDAAIGTTFGASIPDKEVENVVDDALNMGVTSFCDKYVKTGKNYKEVKDFWDAVNLESSAKRFLKSAGYAGSFEGQSDAFQDESTSLPPEDDEEFMETWQSGKLPKLQNFLADYGMPLTTDISAVEELKNFLEKTDCDLQKIEENLSSLTHSENQELLEHEIKVFDWGTVDVPKFLRNMLEDTKHVLQSSAKRFIKSSFLSEDKKSLMYDYLCSLDHPLDLFFSDVRFWSPNDANYTEVYGQGNVLWVAPLFKKLGYKTSKGKTNDSTSEGGSSFKVYAPISEVEKVWDELVELDQKRYDEGYPKPLQSSASRRRIRSAAGDEDDLGVDFGNPPKGETTTPEEFAADEPPADEGFDGIETTTDEDLFNDPFVPDADFSEDELSPTEEEIVTDIHEILESHGEGAITDANAVAAIGQDLIQLGLETVNASEIATQIAAEEASINEEDAGFLGSDVIESSAKKVPVKSNLPLSILKDFKYAKNPETGKYFQFDYETGTSTEVNDINEATIINGSFYPKGYEIVNYKGLPIESSAKRKIQSKKTLSDSQIEEVVNMVAQNSDKNTLSADQVRSLLHSVNDTEEQAQEMVVEMSDLDPFTKSEVIQMLNSSAIIHQNFAVVDQNDTLIDFFPTQEEADSCLETFKAQNPGVRAKVIENKAKRIKSSFVLLDTKNQNRVISSPYEDEATAQQDAEALNSGDAGRYVVKALGQEA